MYDLHPITIRERTPRDLTTRNLSIRAATVREDDRSVEAVFCTEAMIRAFDLRQWETVDEVLLMSGYQAPPGDQVPLYDAHPEKFGPPSSFDVYGAGREMAVQGDTLIGRLFFDSDDESTRLWGKVQRGFLRDVSVGTVPLATTVIEPGQTATVAGRQFTARPDRRCYVRTAWTIAEISITPVGADPAAKIRESFDGVPVTPNQGEGIMNPRLRSYLESIGLAATATVREAWAFFNGLQGDQQTHAATLREANETPPPDETPPEPETPTGTTTRSANTPAPQNVPVPTGDDARVIAIRSRWGENADRYPDLYARCLADPACGVERSAELLRAEIVRQRAPGVDGRAPAGHVRSHEQDCTAQVLGAALMLRQDIPLDSAHFARREAAGVRLHQVAPWTTRSVNDPERQRIMDLAHRFQDMSLIDVCREAIRLDNRNGVNLHDRDEVIRAAVSGGSLSAIFTTTVGAELLAGYVEATDTTDGWTASEDVPNFQSNERASMGKFGALSKLGRGQTAKDMDVSDSKEEYKIARYAGKFTVDEQDIIDDAFGALAVESPRDMGNSARQLRQNMVYALVLANPTLAGPNRAVFVGDNLLNTALSSTAIAAARLAMAKLRERDRPLQITPRYLVCCQDLWKTAWDAISNEVALAVDGATVSATANAVQRLQLQLVTDDRLGAAGVTDPVTGTAYTGAATRWYVFGRPGENGCKTIIVGYRRGTGRAPQLRNYQLNQGQWGIGWDINMDIGAKWLDYRGAVFGND